jgi:hypothetical protein
MFAWKKFQFFDKKEVKIPASEGGPPKQSLQSVTDTCADCGRGCLILGDDEGLVHFIRGGFRWQSYRAYERRVTHVHQLKTRGVLVAVGDDNVAGTVVKILRVNIPQELGEPPAPEPASMIFKTANVTTEKEIVVDAEKKGDADVTCVRGSEDLSYIAVGLSNGAVLLFRGSGLDQVKKIPPQASTTPVTGLFFKTVNQSVPTVLFALTADLVATHLLDTPAGDVSEVLDSNGCKEGCCAQIAKDDNILAGRDEGVFIYEYDGGNCSPAGFRAFEGEKKQLISFTRYLLVAGVNEQDGSDVCNVYDLDNQFVAASNPFVGGIRRVFYEWDSIVVLTNDHRIWRLKERDTADKLEKLYARNLYEVAAELAKSSGYDRHKVSEIYRRFGDHQYEKGEYDSAMTQYLETIGDGVEPSYVIQRFLDVGGAGRIDNLVRYLQRLHELEEANSDHTTLLLNCYTQMGNLDQLDAFIRQEGLNYDVETAINVCRQAGFYEQGLFLAQQHGRHSAWLRLQLDQDKNSSTEAAGVSEMQAVAVPGADRAADCAAALDYIRDLPTFDDAKSAMMQYGRILLSALPDETTQFLIELCTGYTPPGASKSAVPDSNLEEYMDIFLGEDGREQLTVFLERAKAQHEVSGVKLERQTTQKVNETLVELYLQTAQGSPQRASELQSKAMALLEDMETSKVDSDHALVLCHQYEFNEGELHLLSERPGMHRQILEKYMAINDNDRLIEAVQKYARTAIVQQHCTAQLSRIFSDCLPTCHLPAAGCSLTGRVDLVMNLVTGLRSSTKRFGWTCYVTIRSRGMLVSHRSRSCCS